LKLFGLPDGPLGYVISTRTGFTSVDCHLDYINNVVGPFFKQRREKLYLDPQTPALIVQDGLKSYFDEKVTKALNYLFIDTLEIPPHSSHLFQPLDLVTNPSFKLHLRKYKSAPKHLTDRSKRLYSIVYCMNKNINALQNMQAFESAGIIFSYEGSKPLGFNLKKITDKSLSPQEDINNYQFPQTPEKPKQLSIQTFMTANEKRKASKGLQKKPNKRKVTIRFGDKLLLSGEVKIRKKKVKH